MKNSIIGFILIILCGIAAAVIMDKCSTKPSQEGPFIDSMDSTLYWKNKAGQLYQATLIKDKVSDSLEQELKSLKSKDSKPIMITKTRVEFKTDTVFTLITRDIARNDSNYSIRSSYEDEYLRLKQTIVSGDSSSYATLDSLSICANLYNSIILRNGHYYSLVRTDNPYLKIKSQETKLNIKKPSKFGLTLGIGYGVNHHGQCYPYLGIMFGYRLF